MPGASGDGEGGVSRNALWTDEHGCLLRSIDPDDPTDPMPSVWKMEVELAKCDPAS